MLTGRGTVFRVQCRRICMGDAPGLMEISAMVEDGAVDDREGVWERLVDADDGEWEALDDPYHLQLTGVLYNFSEDLGRVSGLDRVIELNERVADRELEEVHAAMRFFQLANAYALRSAWGDDDVQMTFFDSADLVEALGYARASVAGDFSEAVSERREMQSFVNFANILSRTGRVCEALVWYDRAVEQGSTVGMALGNRGQCKMNYAAMLFSRKHAAKVLHSVYADFERALERAGELYPRAEANFRARMEHIDEYADDRLSMAVEDEYELGDSATDRAYHRWVLEHRLYLNPLNDISTHTATAHDFFHLPDMLIPEDDEFPYPGIYNQMKQEFVSARYLYYEAISRADESPHFSDRDVQLPDTLDYTVYGYRTEQLKAALRMSYSIFDKIGTLINEYFGVGQRDPGFHQVWHTDGEYEKGLADPFRDSDNWPLNALYWIKKDFHHSISKRDEESVVVVAHELRRVRTAVEHGYIKVFDDSIVSSPPDRALRALQDSLYDAIGKSELREAALEMLRLARAAMIYLSLAVHHEERKKREELDGPAVPLGGQVTVPDRFKE